MATYLAGITHDIKSNTLEATWLEEVFDLEGNLVDLKRVKSRNYSVEQKDEFDLDTGTTKYSLMAGW